MASTELSPVARALGRVPTGLYIVSTRPPDSPPLGFVGSFLMQVGLDPPVVSVAIGKGRDHLAAIRAAGRFGVTILCPESQGCMGTFFRGAPEGGSPFDQLESFDAPGGSPIVAAGLAWLECRLQGEHDAGDHVVVFGVVESGEQQREGDPSVHLRRNGLDC